MKRLQQALIEQVGARLAKYGFKHKTGSQSFIRSSAAGRQSCHVAFMEHASDFDVTADIAIRFDALEDMMNFDNSFLSKREKQNTYSVGCELGNLVYGEQHRWTIASEADLSNAVKGIGDFFVEHGLPYFEKYSDINSVFELIAPHPEKPSLHAPFLDYRAKAVVCMAILLGKTSEIPALIRDYESQLQQVAPYAVSEFVAFAKKQAERAH